MSTTSQFFSGGSSIKAIQRGVVSITGTNTSATATITSVNTSKTELRWLGSQGAIAQSQGITANIVLSNATTITATRGDGTSGTALNVSWELTEYN